MVLRDTAPVHFTQPSAEDLQKLPGGVVGNAKLEDVYWRLKIRHVNKRLQQECRNTNYSIFTHKNVELDGGEMKESYIFRCKNDALINARAVFSGASVNTVKCREVYANITKVIERKYPFSLKYISGTNFVSETKVIREPVDACVWLHAIAIVESRWE